MNARTNNVFDPSSTRTRLLAMLAGAAVCGAIAPAASAQDFFGMALQPDMRSMVPVGISGIGESAVIAYKAIKEQGVQVYDAPGLLEISTGVFHELPVPLDSNGDYQSAEIFQFRQSPQRGPGEPVKGISVGLIRKPASQAAMLDTSGGVEESVWYVWGTEVAAASEARASNIDGTLLVGTGFLAAGGDEASRRPLRFIVTGPGWVTEPMALPSTCVGGEARGVSMDGGMAVGVGYNAGGGSIGIWWNPSDIEEVHAIDASVAGPDAESLAFTAISDDGGLALATISTTRSNTKGGLYSMMLDELVWLDGGDINGDGQIDLMDDHDSSANALSADGSIVGGSITVGGEELAALWIKGAGGAYEYHDLVGYFGHIGGTGLDGDMAGWTFRAVTGVSVDGTMITGVGVNPLGQTTGWYATIPTPGALPLLGLGGLLAARRRR